ncbi:MAG: hypothetical protein C4B58_14630 [Deltaproteobacteria bacterium]|nr:MAG: hypothetical protein C4B58_14630 [Deltaproteobacteria bacterium]
MKRVTVVILAILMAIGFGTAASASPTLIFDIDFYGGDTAYSQGVVDTGQTINLLPGQTVFVDLYVSLDPAITVVSMGFDLTFDPSNLEAGNLVIPPP